MSMPIPSATRPHPLRRRLPLALSVATGLVTTLLVGLLLTFTPARASELREIDWVELIPADELAELEAMAESGALDIDHDGDQSAPSWGTDRTVRTMDGVQGRIPGYIVPLDTDAENRVTEFFLVPYYGACIHVPPPPPNQIIYVTPDEPIADVEIWQPYWLEGTLRIHSSENAVASASYAFELDRARRYE